MTNDEARKLFLDFGLTYKDVIENLELLKSELKYQLKYYYKLGKALKMTLSKIVHTIESKNVVYLYVNGPYFKRRECISFSNSGFIGFCGWADESNTKPIIEAFISWCYTVKNNKEWKE